MNSKFKGIIVSIGVVIFAVVVYQIFSNMNGEGKAPRVYESIKYARTALVKYSDQIAEIKAYGRLKSFNRIEVYSEVNGIVLESSPKFKVGNIFDKGQILVKVDDEETRLNLYSQKSDFLNQMTRMMPDLRGDFPEAFVKWDSYLNEFSIKGTMKDLPEAETSKEKYFLAARNIFKLYYGIKNLELRLSKHSIRAPFRGAVTERLIETGTSIRTGQKLGEFAGRDIFELELGVDISDANLVSVGNKVKAISEERDIFKGNLREWTGKVTRISDHIDGGTQTKTIFVTLSGKGLYDGMYLKGEIEGNFLKDVFIIPRRALVNNEFAHTLKDSALGLSRVEVVMLGSDYAYIRGIDSLTEVVIDPLADTPVGTKVVPVELKRRGKD